MLRFKQFISEANMSHFAHLGLDPTNPEHKDMVDAYNNGLNHPQNKITAKPNQIKTFDQLKTTVAPHIAAIQKKRQEDAEDKEAFANKEAELVHHDPSTGVKVFKVRSGKGCAAAGSGATGCVYDRETGNQAMRGYDPEGEHSHIIHTPEKGNLSRISIIGVKPGEKHQSGVGGNFQDKGNNTVSDENWEMVRKKYNLDNVKALHGVRGLRNPEVEHLLNNASTALKNPNTSAEDLEAISKHNDNPELHRAIAKHKNSGNSALFHVARKSNDPEVHRVILNHENVGDGALAEVARRSEDSKIHRVILNHPKVGDKALTVLAGNLGPEFEHLERRNIEPEIVKAVLNHPKVGDQALAAAANYFPEEVLEHPKAGDSALASVANNDYDPETHRAILNHPKAGKLAVSAVAKRSEDDPDLHRAIINHKNVGETALAEVAWNSTNPQIHKAIANHEKVGEDALERLSEIYKTAPDKESITKAIDDHIRSKKGNPYQLESFLSAYKKVIKK